jgi:hypothetical protein
LIGISVAANTEAREAIKHRRNVALVGLSLDLSLARAVHRQGFSLCDRRGGKGEITQADAAAEKKRWTFNSAMETSTRRGGFATLLPHHAGDVDGAVDSAGTGEASCRAQGKKGSDRWGAIKTRVACVPSAAKQKGEKVLHVCGQVAERACAPGPQRPEPGQSGVAGHGFLVA